MYSGGAAVRLGADDGGSAQAAGYDEKYRLADGTHFHRTGDLGFGDGVARLVRQYRISGRGGSSTGGHADRNGGLQASVTALYDLLFMICLLGMLPFLLLAAGILTMRIPAMICSGASLLVLLALLIFQREALFNELAKNFTLTA